MLLSFRDPAGFVFRAGERIFRCVYPHAAAEVREFLRSDFAIAQMSQGALVETRIQAEFPAKIASREIPPDSLILAHSAISFPNYPYEWAGEMLESAAELTLRLAAEATPVGYLLKDATPFNVMFEGPRPVFLDLLSFERADSLSPIWPPYAQFVRTFLYPLLVSRYLGLRLDEILLANREGLEPERLRAMLPLSVLLRPSMMGLVALPAAVSRRAGAAVKPMLNRKAKSPGEAEFLRNRVISRAGRALRRLPAPHSSQAVSYEEQDALYTAAEREKKEAAVTAALRDLDSPEVLDIGCNTGRFTLLAARHGARVVAIDRDPAVIGRLWTQAGESAAAVLPLVVDIARPPGGCGWANREQMPFLERAAGRFDCVLMLALVHHLVVNERAPLAEIFDLLATVTRRRAIVEYVAPADPQFQRILRGRDALHADLTPAVFEAAARRRFRVLQAVPLTATRTLYTLDRVDG